MGKEKSVGGEKRCVRKGTSGRCGGMLKTKVWYGQHIGRKLLNNKGYDQ